MAMALPNFAAIPSFVAILISTAPRPAVGSVNGGSSFAPPRIDGRCGPDFGNAACSILPRERDGLVAACCSIHLWGQCVARTPLGCGPDAIDHSAAGLHNRKVAAALAAIQEEEVRLAALAPPPPSPPPLATQVTTTAAPLPSFVTQEIVVEPLGCWMAGNPSALRPISAFSSGWRTVSPITCACLCRTKYGSRWDGLVGLGYQHHFATCSCGVEGWQPFPYWSRGRMGDECCSIYDETLRTVGVPQSISCPCTPQSKPSHAACDAARNTVSDPDLKKSLHGAAPNSWWSNSVFRVTLGAHCAADATVEPAAAPHSAATTTLEKWGEFALCPVLSGFADDAQTCRAPTGTDAITNAQTIRIGARTPTHGGMRDSVFEGIATLDDKVLVNTIATPSGEYLQGGSCSVSLLLRLEESRRSRGAVQLSLALGGADQWGMRKSSEALGLVRWPQPKETTRAEMDAQVWASMDFIRTNAELVKLDRLSCWRKRAQGETAGGEDCVPRPHIDMARPKQTPSRAEAVQFQEVLTANLERDIIPALSDSEQCPNLLALYESLAPLLRERRAEGPTVPGEAPPIAIIVPYRARPTELRKFMRWMVPTLLRDGAPRFRIFVAELGPGMLWNKARLNNAAVREIRKRAPAFGCVIFVDVDLVLQVSAADLASGMCQLTCDADLPVHYSTKLLGYNKPYSHGVVPGVFCEPGLAGCGPPHYHGGQSSGGVVGLTMEQFDIVNGWPNSVWGWGKEDGIFDMRIKGKFGQKTAPREWAAKAGNEKCIWVHMQDKETGTKGASAVEIKEVNDVGDGTGHDGRLYRNGYRQVNALYTLERTREQPLYTVFEFTLHDGRRRRRLRRKEEVKV